MFGSLDRQHRLCEGFSSCISESRDQRYIRHDLLKLIRQRVLQIVAGYEDCNDADTLRSDPMLKTVCDQLPESDPDLATQPTFSRLENSVTKKDLMRLSRWLLGRYVRSLKKRRPSKIILDLDSTDDHTHGQQEFSFYHGYYRNHILHPLLIFDADTGDLVCAVLRPGNKGAASHIVPILKRVVEAIRQAVGTDVEIEIRADSGFATPRLYEFCECEENQLQYVIGLSRNPRLQRVVEPLLDSTRERFLELEEKQRQFDEFLYRAHSWDRSRRVIVKVEVDQRGINRRFVVTNRDDLCSQSLYDHYTNRGQTENFIKAFSRRVVGWSLRNDLKTRLVTDALQMALQERESDGVIHHSDQGTQYTSIEFGLRCKRAGIRPSMGSVGDCYDNALCESFFASLECELIDRHSFRSKLQARLAVFDYIEGFYNPHRRHSSLDYLSPINYESRHSDVA